MLTQSSKVFLPLAAVAFVLAMAYGIVAGQRDGVLLFLGLTVVAGLTGIAVSGERGTDYVPAVDADAPPPELRRVTPSPPLAGALWPALAAAAVTLVLLGFVVGPICTVAGLVVGVAATIGWMTGVSSDHTGRVLSLMPIGIPVVGLFTIFSLMFFVSRVLLAVPEQASTVIALLVAVGTLAGGSLAALKPNLSKQTLVAALVVVGMLLTGGGIVAAAIGPRAIEKPEGISAGPIKVSAKGLQFGQKEITLKADLPAEISFKNNDPAIPHNIAIYSDPEHTKKVFIGDIVPGPITIDYRFEAPPAGTYYFRCDVHVNMQGKLVVTG